MGPLRSATLTLGVQRSRILMLSSSSSLRRPWGATMAMTPRSFASQSRNVAAIRMYRILQRQCQQLGRTLAASGTSNSDSNQDSKMFLLQRPLDPREAGGSRSMENITQSSERSVIRLFSLWINEEYDNDQVQDWVEVVCPTTAQEVEDKEHDWSEEFHDTRWTTVDVLQKAIRYAMRHTPPTAKDTQQQRLYQQWAIRAFQLLQEQESMYRLTSTSTERNVRVTCTSACVGRTITTTTRSMDDADTKFRFAYRIRIENVSPDETIQLLGRTWDIQDYHGGKPKGDPIRVHAPQTGAVGKLPVLQPGEAFEYMSSCELTTVSGVMQGCFHLCRVQADTPSAQVGMRVEAFESPDRFEVTVAPFPLEVD